MKTRNLSLAVLLGLVVLAACSLPRGAPTKREILSEDTFADQTIAIVPITRNNVGGIATWPTTGWHGHYHWLARERGPQSSIIKTGDLVNLTIWDNQSNSLLTSEVGKNTEILRLAVSSSGTIFVPYVDQVAIRGLTETQARELIQNKLERIAPSAQVLLEVQEGLSNSVDLVGGVRQPGTVALPNRNYSIMSLLARSGGISPELENPLVRLVRDEQTYEIRAYQLFQDTTKNVILRGGDQVLVVEDERFFLALGASEQEKPVLYEKEQINALEALSLVGGLLNTHADPKGLLILREYEQKDVGLNGAGPSKPYVIFTLDLTTADGLFAARKFMINPHDTVLATESVLKPAQTIIALFGSAFALANVGG